MRTIEEIMADKKPYPARALYPRGFECRSSSRHFHWEDFCNLDEADFAAFDKEESEAHAAYTEVRTHNFKLEKELMDAYKKLLEVMGIRRGMMNKADGTLYNKYKHPIAEAFPSLRTFFKRTPPSYVMVGDKKISIRASSFQEYYTECRRLAIQKNREDAQKSADYAHAVDYAEKNSISLDDLEGSSVKQVIAYVNRVAADRYRDSIVDLGETIAVTHSDGDDCEWEVGDRRCDCGNNRYYLEVDGNIKNEFYHWGQWH